MRDHFQSGCGLENGVARGKYALESLEAEQRTDPVSYTLDKSLTAGCRIKLHLYTKVVITTGFIDRPAVLVGVRCP